MLDGCNNLGFDISAKPSQNTPPLPLFGSLPRGGVLTNSGAHFGDTSEKSAQTGSATRRALTIIGLFGPHFFRAPAARQYPYRY